MTEPQLPRTGDAVYYQHAGKLPFVTRISQRARLDVYQAFMDACHPGPDTTVLDVGVSLEVSSPESNTLEQHYPYRHRLVCAGIGDGAAVQAAYPGVTFVRIEPHQPLPFRDGEFAIAYCNAVVEHAGGDDRMIAGERPGHVLDTFARADAELGRLEINRMTAELSGRHLHRVPGPGARLFEIKRDAFTFERLVRRRL
jgi:hypothetical protein